MTIQLKHFMLKIHHFFATGTYEDWQTPYKSFFLKFELKKMSFKIKWPEGSNYCGAFLRKMPKSENLDHSTHNFSQFLTKLANKICFFLILILHFQLFCIFLKNAPESIDPLGHFVFYDFFCSSHFCFYFYKGVANLHNCW